MTTAATVKSVQGEAFARSPSGGMRRLSAGDTIQQGEVVITSLGGQVSLATVDGQMINVNSQESFKFGPEAAQATAPQAGGAAVQPVVAQPGEIDVAQILEQDAAAAGLAGGGENSGSSFVRLSRVTEEITPLAYEFPSELGSDILPASGLAGGGAVATELPEEPEEPKNLVPVANNDTADAMVIVTRQVELSYMDDEPVVMGGGENSMDIRLRVHNDDQWLVSNNSNGNPFSAEGVIGVLTVLNDNNGQHSSREFVTTPMFTVTAGGTFEFSVTDAVLNTVVVTEKGKGKDAPDVEVTYQDTFTAELWKQSSDGSWTFVGTIDDPDGDGGYSYQFGEDGVYRVVFNVDNNTNDGSPASVGIDIASDHYFVEDVFPGEDEVAYVNATGNVLTGDGADTLGDGDLADHELVFDGDTDGNGVIDGAYGTLTLEMVDGKYTGAYTYTPNGEGGGTENFGYTLTDADGDSDTATLSINVGMKIIGTGYDDELFGSAGNDTLIGGAGNDRIEGGAGSDIVVINLADQNAEVETDTLSGFNPGEDDLIISDLLESNASVGVGSAPNVVQITSDYGVHQLVFDTSDDAAAILQSLQDQLGQQTA